MYFEGVVTLVLGPCCLISNAINELILFDGTTHIDIAHLHLSMLAKHTIDGLEQLSIAAFNESSVDPPRHIPEQQLTPARCHS